jgi:hypothetical protein
MEYMLYIITLETSRFSNCILRLKIVIIRQEGRRQTVHIHEGVVILTTFLYQPLND